MNRRVLDVGQCDADHSRISDLINREFDVEIGRAHSIDDAIKSALDTRYDLILINRLLDADGSPGTAILNELKSQPSTAEIPVMIISNYEDAQAAAIEAGAVRGFGKAELNSPETRKLLADFLE